jgi:hypothetical protein
MKKYTIVIQQYQQSTAFVPGSNAITFINNGASIVLLNNIPLAIGASLSIEGNESEIDITQYTLNFGNATNGNILVIQKMFV